MNRTIVRPDEKLTEQVKLLLPETMLRDLRATALTDDRSVSEYIRHVLRLHLYGRTPMQEVIGGAR